MSINDEKIFLYLRLRDDKKVILRSRIREFAAMGKLMADFMKEVWEKYGLQSLNTSSLEYVDANSDLVLISLRKDVVRQTIIISGLIPKEYQGRMLDADEAKLKFSAEEFVERAATNLDLAQKEEIRKKVSNPPFGVLGLIKQNIKENGEFYIVLQGTDPNFITRGETSR